MASRRQKKKVAKRKQLHQKIGGLKKIGERQLKQNINVRKYTEKELDKLENLVGVKPANINMAIEEARSTPDIGRETKASKIGSYYKHDLIERYYDLVDAGYIVPELTDQEVYDMAPQIIENITDEEKLQRMVEQGERKMDEARQRNLRAREANLVVFDY